MKQIKCVSLLFYSALFSIEILGVRPSNTIQPQYNNRNQSITIKKIIRKLRDTKKIPCQIPEIQKNFKNNALKKPKSPMTKVVVVCKLKK